MSELSTQAQTAYDVLTTMLREMDFPGAVEVTVTEDADQVLLSITSSEPLALLIGKGGATLNAIELLVTQITRHKTHEYGKRLVVDAEGYRARQNERLEELARATAVQVLESGESVALEPMTARDRRVVHTAVSEIEGVATYSAGEEPYRHIVICLPGQEKADGDE